MTVLVKFLKNFVKDGSVNINGSLCLQFSFSRWLVCVMGLKARMCFIY